MVLFPSVTTATFVTSIELISAGFILYLVGFSVYNRYFHPYKDFPGPFLASITSLW